MPEIVSRANILIQMIDLHNVEEEQAIKITRLTNTQNKIDGKDFAALDPEHERLKNELNFFGIQYLYKTGAIIEDSVHQITFDEAIIAQACSLNNLSIVAMAKRNVGALTENIDKPPYKLLFNGDTNCYTLVNNIRVTRSVDAFLFINEAHSTGRRRLVLVHGNRFILHMVLLKIMQREEYNNSFLEQSVIEEMVNSLCPKYWEMIYQSMEKLYQDAYPAHIFKNVGRLQDIKKDINGE